MLYQICSTFGSWSVPLSCSDHVLRCYISALKTSRLLEDMAMRGVRYIDCYGVDNALVRPPFLVFGYKSLIKAHWCIWELTNMYMDFLESGACCRPNVRGIFHG